MKINGSNNGSNTVLDNRTLDKLLEITSESEQQRDFWMNPNFSVTEETWQKYSLINLFMSQTIYFLALSSGIDLDIQISENTSEDKFSGNLKSRRYTTKEPKEIAIVGDSVKLSVSLPDERCDWNSKLEYSVLQVQSFGNTKPIIVPTLTGIGCYKKKPINWTTKSALIPIYKSRKLFLSAGQKFPEIEDKIKTILNLVEKGIMAWSYQIGIKQFNTQ